MTQTANRKELELDYLLQPAGAFRAPMDVVNDPEMTVQEKRPFSRPGPPMPAPSKRRRICGGPRRPPSCASTTSWMR
jgi:hypothetical protein